MDSTTSSTTPSIPQVTQASVFLITSDGQTLNLPIPSQSPDDPLNWSPLKRFFAVGAMGLFSVVGLILVQGTSLLLEELMVEYVSVSQITCPSHDLRVLIYI